MTRAKAINRKKLVAFVLPIIAKGVVTVKAGSGWTDMGQ